MIPLLSWAISERFRDDVHDKALDRSTLLYSDQDCCESSQGLSQH